MHPFSLKLETCFYISIYKSTGSPDGSVGKEPVCSAEKCRCVLFLCQKDPLEEGTATHSSVLAWSIPRTEEPGGLQSTGGRGWTRLKQLSMHSYKSTPSYDTFFCVKKKTLHFNYSNCIVFILFSFFFSSSAIKSISLNILEVEFNI